MFGRIVDWILLVGSLVGLAFAGWWTVYGAPNSAENLETKLQAEVEAALVEGGHDWVHVEMDGQHAHLTGKSPNFEAEEAVMVSLGGENLLMGKITKTTSEVISAPPISPYIFTAAQDPDTGFLMLGGHVPSREILAQVLARAEEISSGHVSMDVKIGSGEPLGPWKDVVLTGLDTFKTLSQAKLELKDSNLYLSGQSETGKLATQPFIAFTGADGMYDLHLDIRGPALWSVSHDGNNMILSGVVADDAQRNRLIELANEHFSGGVRDAMILEAGGDDRWIDVLTSLMPGFADFQSGEIAFTPDGDGFTVAGKAAGSVQTYIREDLVEGDYPVVFDVETISADLAELAGLDFASDQRGACQAGFDEIMAASKIQFQTSKAEISRESGLTLDKVVAVAERCSGLSIEVRGHTDSAGGREGNIALSEARANAVKDYMIAGGIASGQLQIIGLGPDAPIADNASAAGRAANRRIEFKIIEEG